MCKPPKSTRVAFKPQVCIHTKGWSFINSMGLEGWGGKDQITNPKNFQEFLEVTATTDSSKQNPTVLMFVWRLQGCWAKLKFPWKPNETSFVGPYRRDMCITKQISITMFWSSSDCVTHTKMWPQYFCFTAKRNWFIFFSNLSHNSVQFTLYKGNESNDGDDQCKNWNLTMIPWRRHYSNSNQPKLSMILGPSNSRPRF